MNSNYPRIVIAGTHSGVGKTTLVLGLTLALKRRGFIVQNFKTGPDYIDPTYHLEGSGRTCANLDSWLLSKSTILRLFSKHAQGADISIIEGVMGLYDGLKSKESGSTSHLTKMLDAPVILILDARSLSRSAAALVLGYKEFDKKVKIKGVILNRIASARHYEYIKDAVESKTHIPVLGYLPRDAKLELPSRHLGLVPAEERKKSVTFYKKLAGTIEKYIDVDRIYKLSSEAKFNPPSSVTFGDETSARFSLRRSERKESAGVSPQSFNLKSSRNYLKVAVAKDKAFNFYYKDNLDILEDLGAKLVFFSPIKDKALPKGLSGLYMGGGFPEIFAQNLARNEGLRREVYQKAEAGLPIYAECGGLMYLMEKLIDFAKKTFPMVGIFPASVNMAARLRSLGYVNIEVMHDNILSKKGDKNKAHIFHWSYLDNIPKDTKFAYQLIQKSEVRSQKSEVRRQKTEDRRQGIYDGLIKWNVLASYAHLHFASNIKFAKNFISSCRRFMCNLEGN